MTPFLEKFDVAAGRHQLPVAQAVSVHQIVGLPRQFLAEGLGHRIGARLAAAPPNMPPPPILANMVPAQTDSLLSADAKRILQPLGQDAQAAARAGTRFGPPLVTLPPLGAPLIRLYPAFKHFGIARVVYIPLELAEPEPGIHERLGIRNRYAAGADAR